MSSDAPQQVSGFGLLILLGSFLLLLKDYFSGKLEVYTLVFYFFMLLLTLLGGVIAEKLRGEKILFFWGNWAVSGGVESAQRKPLHS